MVNECDARSYNCSFPMQQSWKTAKFLISWKHPCVKIRSVKNSLLSPKRYVIIILSLVDTLCCYLLLKVFYKRLLWIWGQIYVSIVCLWKVWAYLYLISEMILLESYQATWLFRRLHSYFVFLLYSSLYLFMIYLLLYGKLGRRQVCKSPILARQ